MIRMLHLADLHLGWEPAWEESADARRRERDCRLEKAVSWALASEIDIVLIAGDLFETHRPGASSVASVKAELSRLVQAGISVVTVPGNHDEISYHDSVYREHALEWPGILVQNPNLDKVVSLQSPHGVVHVYSLAYTGGLTRTESPLYEFPRTQEEGYHIAIIHGSLDWNRGDRSLPIDGQALQEAGYDYVALGHIHQHRVAGLPGAPVAYAGMIDGKGFDDPGVGFYTVATLSPSGTRLETATTDTRPIRTLRIDAGAYGDLGAMTAAVRPQLDADTALRVALVGTPEFPISSQALKDVLQGETYHLEVSDETEGLADETLESIAAERTVRGAFAARMLHRLHHVEEQEKSLVKRALIRGLAALRGGAPHELGP